MRRPYPQRFDIQGRFGRADTSFFSPGNMLRNFPQLQTKRVIEGAVNCVRKIPNELYEQLVHHME